MTLPITKSIKGIKNDIGVYFTIKKNFGTKLDSVPLFSTNNFLQIWINGYNKKFNDKVDFLYAIYSGEYKKKGLYLNIYENFNSNYVISNIKNNDRNDLFLTINDVKKYIKNQLLFDLELFIYNKNNNFILNSIKKNNCFKKLILKTSLGKKIDYLIKHQEILQELSFDSLMDIKMVYEYEDENKKVIIPENWDTFINSDGFKLNFVSFEEMSESKATLYSAFYDKKANAMSLTFETETEMAYNYQQLDFDVDYNKYVFSDPGVYLTKDEAQKGMLDIIAGYEERIAKIKAQLS